MSLPELDDFLQLVSDKGLVVSPYEILSSVSCYVAHILAKQTHSFDLPLGGPKRNKTIIGRSTRSRRVYSERRGYNFNLMKNGALAFDLDFKYTFERFD